MTIALTEPHQITMWVLLSRRAQLKLQAKGIKTPGLIKWCRENIEGCEKARTWKDCVLPVEYAIAEGGGPQDFSIVNVHVMRNLGGGTFSDLGIFNDMTVPEANEDWLRLYANGGLEIVYTMDEPRDAIPGMLYQSA